MKEQSKRGKALSLALTASLVATLNVPAVAFADCLREARAVPDERG